jgi:hypothetical protein
MAGLVRRVLVTEDVPQAEAPPAPKKRRRIGIEEFQTPLGYVKRVIYEDE